MSRTLRGQPARRRVGTPSALVGLATLWVLADHTLPHGAPPAVVLLGLVLGSVTALTAIGLILVYRASRVVNFAHAALGGVGGSLAVNLFLRAGWNYPAAVVAGVAAGVVVGGLVESVVVRRLARGPRLVLTVATIGVAQLLGGVELLIPKAFGSNALLQASFATPLRARLTIGPVVFTGDHVLIVLAVPVVLGALSWFLLRTDAGVAVRAAAENPERAMGLGIPVRRLSTLVWMTAGGLSALTVVLRAPFAGGAPAGLLGPTLLLPSLAAAVVAGMESLPVAVGAGLGLGVLEQVVLWNTSRASLVDVVFLLVILVALVLRPAPKDRAGGDTAWLAGRAIRPLPDELRHLPEVRVARVAVPVALLVAGLAVPLVADSSTVNVLAVTAVWCVVGVSLVVLTGWGGNISLGQFAIVGTAAVVAGNLVTRTRLDFFEVVLVAAVAGVVVALALGLPALRMQGPFLAVTTLAFAVALDHYFLNPTYFSRSIPQQVPRPVLWQRFDLERETVTYYVAFGLLVLAVLAAGAVRRARTGRVVRATRDNAPAAETFGVPTVSSRLAGFALAGAMAGAAGALHVVILHGTRLGSYQPTQSIEVFSMVVIGGAGSLGGGLAGVIGVRLLRDLADAYRLLITGGGLLVVVLLVPGGLAEGAAGLRDRLLSLVARRRGITLRGPVDQAVDEQPTATFVEGPVMTVGGRRDDPRLVLSCRSVEVSYGSLQVLFGVDLDVREGEIVALLGTNGAGKSTLLRAVSGLTRVRSGAVSFDGRPVTGCSAVGLARAGVALMPGGRGVFPSLTVEENLRLGGWLLRHDHARAAALADAIERFPMLRDRSRQRAGNLSGGEQQMLALAQSLMTRPRLLLIDELSLGLAPKVVGKLVEVVADLNRSGVAVVVVEQSVNVALALARRAVFLEKGTVRFNGPTDALLGRPDVLHSTFLGTAARSGNGRRPAASRSPGRADGARSDTVDLECRSVVKRFGGIAAVRDLDLVLRRGESLGLIGPNGAGKTTVLDCISGFVRPDSGRILLRGRDVTGWAPHERAVAGLGRSFQDARLFPSLTVAETIAVARERHLASRDPIAAVLRLPASVESERRVGDEVDALAGLLGLGDFRSTPVGELSTGTRRVVDLACMLAHAPRILLLDEPSAGLAQRETEALAPLLTSVRVQLGCSMVVVDHDMPLLSEVCDELVAMEVGAVVVRGSPETVLSHPTVLASYLGDDETVIFRSGRARRRPAATAPTATARRGSG